MTVCDCHQCNVAGMLAYFGYWAAGLLQSDGAAADGCATMRMPRSLGVPGGRLRPAAPLTELPPLPPSCPLSSPTPDAAPAASVSTHCRVSLPLQGNTVVPAMLAQAHAVTAWMPNAFSDGVQQYPDC